jgi:trk system potassium uptake protein TrkA
VKTVIVGCGRVGSVLAASFDKAGHEVIILDLTSRAFDRLPASFKGTALRGDGTDEDILRRAGAQDADIFIAMTEGDNRNVMAAQLATEVLGIDKEIAKINDPLRAKAYAELGIATLCRTGLMVNAMDAYLELPKTELPGMLAPTGHHEAHHEKNVVTSSAAPSLAAGPVAGGALEPAGVSRVGLTMPKEA